MKKIIPAFLAIIGAGLTQAHAQTWTPTGGNSGAMTITPASGSGNPLFNIGPQTGWLHVDADPTNIAPGMNFYFNRPIFSSTGIFSSYNSFLSLQTSQPAGGGGLIYDQRMVISNLTGFVGINNPTPTAMLDIKSMNYGNGVNSILLNTTAYGNGRNRNFFLVPNLGAGGYNNLSQNGDFGLFWTDASSALNSTSGLVIAPWAGSSAGLRIAPNGNVGIGTGTPSTPLEVSGTIKIDGIVPQINTGANWTVDNWGTSLIVPNFSAIRVATPGLGTAAILPSHQGKYLGFGMGDNNTVGTNGSMLLGWYWMTSGGTTNNDCVEYPMSLTVDHYTGNATLTLSQNGWCDFVFANDYKQMSILDKEAFYKLNKHLPGIETAAIIEQNGMNIGGNMKGMLQNLEEDRLDITALYKIIKAQQAQLEELKEQLSRIHGGK